jgi:DNA-directed RNA polymerase subunit beta'
LIGLTTNEVDITEKKYEVGHITSVERFQKVIDIWNNASNFLKDEVITYFREGDPLNPLYIMAFSGARGNISQVRQLVGMRGLMADPQGQIIDLPIKSNFREGLKVTEYIISSYGARKGLVDTALRTADSGYLTRRLVDVAQDIIVREKDCQTKESLSKEDLEKYAPSIFLKDKVIGRLLSNSIILSEEDIYIASDTEITAELFNKITLSRTFNVRSPLTCNSTRSVCRNCYGWHLSYSSIVDLGEAVGIIAAQSIGEPGTQLTMRTFHTGGVFSGDLTKQIRAPFQGTAFYSMDSDSFLVRTIHGEKGFVLNEKIILSVQNEEKTNVSLLIPKNATLLVNNGQKIYQNQIIAEVKKEANLILEEDKKDIYTEVSGEVYFRNVEVGKISDRQGTIINVSKKTGLIWILYGERFSLPRSTKLKIKLGETVSPYKISATRFIVNNYPGLIKIDSKTKSINVLNFSLTLKNSFVNTTPKSNSQANFL